jgi:hypothetical protein
VTYSSIRVKEVAAGVVEVDGVTVGVMPVLRVLNGDVNGVGVGTNDVGIDEEVDAG